MKKEKSEELKEKYKRIKKREEAEIEQKLEHADAQEKNLRYSDPKQATPDARSDLPKE